MHAVGLQESREQRESGSNHLKGAPDLGFVQDREFEVLKALPFAVALAGRLA